MKVRVLLAVLILVLIGGDKSRHYRRDDGKYQEFPANAIKVPIPDVQQPDDYSCGAAAFMSICSYYGVGPEELDVMKSELRTTSRNGTY